VVPVGEGPVGGDQTCSPPVLVVVASFSRCITARMVPSRTTPDLLAGIWSLLAEELGAVPRRAPGRGGSRVYRDPGHQNRAAQTFRPESKGIVKGANGYLETSFPPGRPFSSPADFNHQLRRWLPIANRRMVRSLGARPIDRLDIDRAAMLPLPPVAPTLGHRSRVRLGRLIGKMVETTAGLDEVTVTAEGRHGARDQRVWATG
jgi:hypothetical protein